MPFFSLPSDDVFGFSSFDWEIFSRRNYLPYFYGYNWNCRLTINISYSLKGPAYCNLVSRLISFTSVCKMLIEDWLWIWRQILRMLASNIKQLIYMICFRHTSRLSICWALLGQCFGLHQWSEGFPGNFVQIFKVFGTLTNSSMLTSSSEMAEITKLWAFPLWKHSAYKTMVVFYWVGWSLFAGLVFKFPKCTHFIAFSK